jgi:predicted  nucleic acid-binding Zn-ribbon protein
LTSGERSYTHEWRKSQNPRGLSRVLRFCNKDLATIRRKNKTIFRACGRCHKIVTDDDVWLQACPACGWPLVTTTASQSSLNKHRGYQYLLRDNPYDNLQELDRTTKKICGGSDVHPWSEGQKVVRSGGVGSTCGTPFAEASPVKRRAHRRIVHSAYGLSETLDIRERKASLAAPKSSVSALSRYGTQKCLDR